MDRLGRLFLAAVLCCLFLLASGALVSGPDAVPEDAQPLAPTPETAITAVVNQADVTQTADRQSPRREAERSVPRQAEAVVAVGTAVECDGNGCVLRGQTYIRAVYQAFPPESLPG